MYPRIYCAPDEGAAAGGTASGNQAGNPPAPEKTFTQADLDRIVGQRLATEKKASDALRAEVEAAKAKLAEFDSLTTRLQALEDEKLSAAEKAKKDADRAAKIIADEKAALTKELAAAREEAKQERALRLRGRSVNLLTRLYAEAKGVPGGLPHALPALLAEIELDFDEHDNPTGARLDGVSKAPLDALKAWLAKPNNDLFQQHPGGGSGAQKPNGAGLSGRPLHEVDSQSLIREGLRGVLAK